MKRVTPQKSSPLISVIIANWNGRHFLDECLESLQKQTLTDFEVIIVDNGSTDGSSEWVRSKYDDFVKLIQMDRNYGFAGGNNIGMGAAKGKYIVLLNNDTVVNSDFLAEIIKPAELDDRVGMCASKILIYDKPDLIDAVGQLLYKDGLNRQKGHLEKDNGQYDEDREILFPPGCGSLYRRKMLDEIGLFDEDFFAYGEDTDLGIRGRLAGWKCVYTYRAVVYHKGSGSTGKYSSFKAFHVERNRVWFVIKCFPFGLLVLTPLFTLLRFFYQALGAITHRGAAGQFTKENSYLDLVLILLKSYASAFRHVATMWKKRRIIQTKRKISDREFFFWFKYYGISAKELALMD